MKTEKIFRFITKQTKTHKISTLCNSLNVSRAGYYASLKNTISKRKRENQEIVQYIYNIRSNRYKRNYGAPRLKIELLEKYGLTISCKRITRLMKENDITTNFTKKFKNSKNIMSKVKARNNLLKQNFTVTHKNRAWVTDITYIWTTEGWLYLSSILDLWSKKIVAYEVLDKMTSDLVNKTLEKEYEIEKPNSPLIIHSDQGSQHRSKEYTKLKNKLGVRHSMSRKGNCYDNAVIESFQATIKKEMIYLSKPVSKMVMKLKIFDYIEGFYNRERRHGGLNNLSPLNFEKMFAKPL